MRKQLILFVGDQDDSVWLIRMLSDWSQQHPEVDFAAESIHVNPARAVQLRIKRLPALIFNDHIVAQGDPITWMPSFLDQLLSCGGTHGV